MAVQPKKHYAMDELEQYYLQVESLYDLTATLVDTLESPDVKSIDTQMALVEPLITEITDATDVLTEEFLQVAKGARHNMSHTASKSRIESSLRRIYTALNEYRTRSARAYGQTTSRLREMTDRAVDAIHEQVERVIALFVEFIQLSLQNLMSKADMDLLFQRQQKLALAMHAQAMGQQGGSGNF
jgi:hypothetical protein